ncbi:MAG TPA: hypothetical protein VGW14_08045 [Thermoleophilaceae bacterium]|nr:hypothetical protein [Thermoleophilaceae bacterium]
MSKEEQLQWEARFGRPAALAAFAAGLLLFAGTVILQTMLEDRENVEPLADFLLSVDESPSSLILQSIVQGLGALCLIPVFYYLFRATIHRVPQIPRWFVYFIFVGPVLYGAAQVFGAVDRVDVAEMFAARDYSFDDPDPERLSECPAIRGELGGDCAQELLQENANLGAALPSLIGSVLVAFMYVMVPLRARRAGLLSPFMAILGVIAGVLLVLQLVPLVPIIVQAFWLGAVGALFLGNWPGGRGPAWESGEPDPWPSAAERRGLTPPPDEGANGGANGGGPSAPPEPEPVPDRPSSRKRKRKRR